MRQLLKCRKSLYFQSSAHSIRKIETGTSHLFRTPASQAFLLIDWRSAQTEKNTQAKNSASSFNSLFLSKFSSFYSQNQNGHFRSRSERLLRRLFLLIDWRSAQTEKNTQTKNSASSFFACVFFSVLLNFCSKTGMAPHGSEMPKKLKGFRLLCYLKI